MSTKDEARALVRERVEELKAARQVQAEPLPSAYWFAAQAKIELARQRLEGAVNAMLEVPE